jgi:hypothetical protein
VNSDGNEDDDDNEADTGLGLHKIERMSHSIGFKPLEEVLAYIEQQGETTETDISLKHWCSLTERREEKLGNRLQSLIFLNNNFCVFPCCMPSVVYNQI